MGLTATPQSELYPYFAHYPFEVEELAPPGPVSFEDYRAQRVDQCVDATGAGDAFVAGFLHAWLEKRSLGECIRLASNVAAKVVTQVGCNLP